MEEFLKQSRRPKKKSLFAALPFWTRFIPLGIAILLVSLVIALVLNAIWETVYRQLPLSVLQWFA